MNKKTIKKLKKIIPVSFIVLFAASLFIPNTGLPRIEINAREVASRENRKIYSFPTNSISSKEFYTQFDNWYQDRLYRKYKLISLWSELNYNLGVSIKEDIILGKNGWLFSRARCLNSFKDSEKKIKIVKQIQNYCSNKHKDFIFITPPNNETIYRNMFPDYEKKKYKNPTYITTNAVNQIKSNQIKYISLKEDLLKEKEYNSNTPLYFKDDHHWSYYGSSIATNTLLKEINKVHKDLKYKGLSFDGSTRTAYKSSYYSNSLGFNQSYVTIAPWSKNFTENIYLTKYTGKTEKVKQVLSHNILWESMAKGEAIITNRESLNKIKILIIGTSYSTYMSPYLSQFCEKVILTHYSNCQGNKNEVNISRLIKKYNPDVVILEILENEFYHTNINHFAKIKIF